MAAGNNSNAAYYNITNGKICRQFKHKTASSIERTNKNGVQVHEEFYDYIEGTITNVMAKDGNYGKFWEVQMQDGDEKYLLQFQYSSGYANAFLMALPNVDLSQPVRIVPKQTIEGDKKRTALFINQDGQGIKWAWTKENPGDLPQMKQVKVKGQLTWDDSEKMEYLEAMVKSVMLEHFAHTNALVTTEAQGEEDDLPF